MTEPADRAVLLLQRVSELLLESRAIVQQLEGGTGRRRFLRRFGETATRHCMEAGMRDADTRMSSAGIERAL